MQTSLMMTYYTRVLEVKLEILFHYEQRGMLADWVNAIKNEQPLKEIEEC